MERREFLKLALGFTAAAGAIVTTASAQAAPMLPPARDLASVPKGQSAVEPAIATQDDVDAMQPEQVRWGWRRRRWRRYHWRPRYWRRRYWRPRVWRRRYWRPRRRVYYY